jgi:hypothetical protein
MNGRFNRIFKVQKRTCLAQFIFIKVSIRKAYKLNVANLYTFSLLHYSIKISNNSVLIR